VSGPSELDIALARPDIQELLTHITAFIASGGRYSSLVDGDDEAALHLEETIGRIFESPYNDPERLLAYIALIAAQREALECHDAMAIGHIEAFFMRLETGDVTPSDFDPIFERMIAAARIDGLWSSMLRTSAWWSLPKRYRDQLVKTLGFPADE
jgi:hypothetical protein